MESYRIVCTTQSPADYSHDHAHIVKVGINTKQGNRADTSMTLDEVLKKLDWGDDFYTIGEKSGKKIFVQAVTCCGKRYIKTYPDQHLDNNLDNLRACEWQK